MSEENVRHPPMLSKNQKISVAVSISTMILGIVVALAPSILIISDDGPPGSSPAPTEFAIAGIILSVASLAIVVILFLNSTKSWFRHIISIDRTLKDIHNERLQSNMYEYTQNTITSVDKIINSLNTKPTLLDGAQVKRLMKIMFKTKADYFGIDYNLPSKFYTVYPYYLDAHKSSLFNRSGDELGYRIMALTPDQLQEDSTNENFSEFYDWHTKNSVGLYMVTPTAINTKLNEVGIIPERCNNGIAFWKGEFTILFTKSDIKGAVYVEILDNTNKDFKKIERLFDQLEREKSKIDEHGTYKAISPDLATEWSNYVLPKERWNDIRDFLYRFLDKYKDTSTIMDAAAGIGIEYQNMIVAGYVMDANEYQAEMVETGKKYALEHQYKIEYEPTRHDWRVMLNFGMKNKYGAVLVIGNSLRVLSDKKGQQKSVDAFYAMLRDGGTLIIDERNFRLIIEGQDKVESCMNNKDSNQLFNTLLDLIMKPSPLYHGTSIKSIPSAVNPAGRSIQFTYYRTTNEKIVNMKSVLDNKMHDWEFFHFEDMETLLKNAGFKTIKKYADYKLSQEVIGDNHSDASMYVYVAIK